MVRENKEELRHSIDVDALIKDIRRELGERHPLPAANVADGKELLARVREEVARRKSQAAISSEDGYVYAIKWGPAQPRLVPKREYVLGELTSFDDEDFVTNAYLAILRRPPDAAGFSGVLHALREGKSKVELLGMLRWSQEGISRSVHIDGLLLPYTLQRWEQKRFIGLPIAWLHGLLKLGVMGRRQRVAEAKQARETHELGRLLNRLAEVEAKERYGRSLEMKELALEVNRGQRQFAGKIESATDALANEFREHSSRVELQINSVRSELDQKIVLAGSDIHREIDRAKTAVQKKISKVENESQQQILQAKSELQQKINLAKGDTQLQISGVKIEMQHESHRVKKELMHELNRLSQEMVLAEGVLATVRAAVDAAELRMSKLSEMEEEWRNQVAEKEGSEEFSRSLAPVYADFEDSFRGSKELIRRRVEPYLDWVQEGGEITKDAPILDVGCGRGEWIELALEHGMQARGIDLNYTFVQSCREIGLDVIEGDAIRVLKTIPDGSVGAVTSMHLVEHLPYETLIQLLDEAYRVLRPGGVVALETPNPENLSVSSHWFFLDPTHRNPLPPVTLAWLVRQRGFVDPRIERLTEARDLGAPPLLPPELPGATSVNVLLDRLLAAADYSIVARKPNV